MENKGNKNSALRLKLNIYKQADDLPSSFYFNNIGFIFLIFFSKS